MAIRSVVLAGLVAGLLIGCSSKLARGPAPTVEIPVPVMPEVPKQLKNCGEDEPRFQFRPHPEDESSVVLYPEDQWELRRWVEGKDRCRDAWRVWGQG